MFSRYNTINTILIESVYPFTYVIIVMICNFSYLSIVYPSSLSKNHIWHDNLILHHYRATNEGDSLLCTYFSEVDIPHSMCYVMVSEVIVIKLICQINYYYFTRITR